MQTLMIGDRTEDGSIVVRDEDRLCYQVLSTSRGSTGVRTISKALLSEWVDAVKEDPHAQGGDLRQRLCGKTDVDKFEYGYFATLKKMADMILDNEPLIREGLSDLTYTTLCKAGVQFWTYSPGKQASEWEAVRKDGVIALNYHEVGDFSKLGDKDAVVAAFQAAADDEASHKNAATAVIDFRDEMKPGDYVFAKKGMSTYIGVGKVTGDYFHDTDTPSEFRERRKIDWFKVETHELPDNKAALKTLTNVTNCREFVKSLLDAFGLTSEQPVEEPDFDVDRLCVALKAFAQHRSDESWAAGYYETNKGTRDYYATLSASIEALDAAKVEEMFLGVKDGKGTVVFQPMWSGSNGTGWGHVKKGLEENPQATIDAIKKYCADASVVSAFTQKEFVRPSGFGDSVVSELLMKFHPDAAIKCGTKTISVLKKLNLMSFKHEGSYDGWEYRQVLGIATGIKLRMDEMGITRTLEDHEEADYITVNEFIAWCHDNYDLIMQEWSKHMKHEIKLTNQVKDVKFKDFVDAFYAATKKANLKYDADLVRRFVCALMAKPFVVLTGLSGSGKTKLAEAFTEWIGMEGMSLVVPVGADWTNNEKMLGYPNALDGTKYVLSDTGILKFLLDARDNPTVPFFLVLDEMNLSHVERYFADFLSAMESSKTIHLYDGDARMSNDGLAIPAELEIPTNLFVIGTMNVDETTYMFSPKVLDRAQVIEFRVSPDEMKNFLAAPTYPKMDELKGNGVVYAEAFLALAKKRSEKKIADADANKELQDVLNAIFPELAKLGSEFAYRCAIEVVTFVAYYLDANGYDKLAKGEDKKKCRVAAIDAAMLQKLLPKLHGSLNRLGPAIDVMLEKFSERTDDGNGGETTTPVYPLSHDKLLRMKDRLEANGFTSYAEA